jgi:predicted DNA-binding transcriptional regulator YafY
MRADRLLSLLMMLQTRGRMTAERLSEELEVSVRTIYRDIYALRVAGFPVDSERGLGGGCYLHDHYRMRLTDLTQDELTALFTMAVPTSLVDLGVGQQAKGALLKLAAALPAGRRNVEQSVRNRFHLDPQSWHSTSNPLPTLASLREGVWADRWMDVTFLRLRGIRTTKTIAPYGLVAKATKWYIIWRGRDQHMHVDRASAIIQAELLGEHFERLEGFDLPAYWSQWVARAEARRPSFLVSARVRADVIPFLMKELGGDRLRQMPDATGGNRVPVRLEFEYLEQARSLLLGLGAAVEVVAPAALRRSVEDFAEQILSAYKDVPASVIDSI